MAELIKDLCRINGVSGNEGDVRKYIISKIKDKMSDITVDSMGNVIALKRGRKSGKKIMLVSNMDEPGFIVSGVTDKGYLKIKNVGSIDSRVIISKKVIIGSGVKGIIGMKAIHLQKKSERENTVATEDLFVDIGASSKKNALKKVNLGDYVTFDTEYRETERRICAKAIDRAGCACLIAAADSECEYDTYFVFSTQKEVEARGARVAAHRIQPDVVVTVGTVETADMYGVDRDMRCAVLGKGAVIADADKTMLADKRLTEFLKKLAGNSGICIQESKGIKNKSVGGAVQTAANGAAVCGISIPCRYSHTPACMADKHDIEQAKKLVKAFSERVAEIWNY